MNKTLSLAMIKMEKNFVAHNDKDYPRKPYSEYPIFSSGKFNLCYFVIREMAELEDEMYSFKEGFDREKLYRTMLEIADVSNTLDFLFERLLEEHHTLEDTVINTVNTTDENT